MRDLIYLSYSPTDAQWHARLRQVLDRDDRLHPIIWDNTKIPHGADIGHEIDAHVARARIMVMLISPEYLAPTCSAADGEFTPAIAAAQRGEVTLFWIPVHDAQWSQSPIGHLRSATGATHPLQTLSPAEQQQALEVVYQGILRQLGLPPRQFEVFLCHNSHDKPAVKHIAAELQSRGLRPWLDEWELRPGLSWQRALEEQIASIGAAAVFVGPDGMGPWQAMEQEAFLRAFVNRRCPVIPVILPGVHQTPELPTFLAGMTWVDFRNTDPNPLDQLTWGITGVRPDTTTVVNRNPSSPSPASQIQSSATPTAASGALGIWKKKLAFLQLEEAKTAGAAQRFELAQQIDEAKAKMRELGG